jgi:nicotinamide-nucleotide amidase
LGVELGYCARPGEVDLRIIGNHAQLEDASQLVLQRLGADIFTTDQRSIEQVIVETLTGRGETLAVAESCTGGYIANHLTNVAGASQVFLAGYVTYANAAKISALGVDAKLIDEYGAVSEAVACAMAEGALRVSGANYALATTGIAGPGGGSEQKPVGTVFIALAQRDKPTEVQKRAYPSDRETFKDLTSQTALDMLLRKLDGRGSTTQPAIKANCSGV